MFVYKSRGRELFVYVCLSAAGSVYKHGWHTNTAIRPPLTPPVLSTSSSPHCPVSPTPRGRSIFGKTVVDDVAGETDGVRDVL